MKTNGYWMGVIADSYFRNFDSHSDYKKIVEALTPQDICNFMKEFNKANNHITVTMLPQE